MITNSKHYLTALALSTVMLVGAGCADTANKRPEVTFESAAQHRFIPTNQQAASTLLAQARSSLASGQPIIVATLVDINALERSSTMGRMISEQISATFSRSGYSMIEMKFRGNVYIKQSEGELLLTREITDIATSHNAQAVVVGTYGVASDIVFINLKVVQPGSNVVLAAHDYALPIDENIRAMLRR
jgi:TolB-like protein